MTKAERKLLEKAALAAFNVFLKTTERGLDTSEIAMDAWEAAYTFIKSRYDYILDLDIPEADALYKILEIDGNIGLLSQYTDKPEPFRAYAEDNIGRAKTTGQAAINRFLEKQDTMKDKLN